MEKVLLMVGKRIREIRKSKGLSQESLGELAGFHFSYIGGVERGEKNISLANLSKIAKALKVPLSDFFHYEKHLRVGLSHKEATFNRIIQRISELNDSDLNKLLRIINEVFNK